MADRLAPVIGSECAALGELEFPATLACGLHDTLTRDGVWHPAVGGAGPLLDPSFDEMRHAVTAAFAAANARQATLLIAFVGHGMTTAAKDFHLMCTDSPAQPDPESAFHLAEGIRYRINAHPSLDGLIVLVDACDAGEGVQGAAQRWPELLNTGGRMELLVASSDTAAYSGCFTRTLTNTLTAGISWSGEHLLCGDLVPTLARSCTRQLPQHLSFTSGTKGSDTGDVGLWLVPNIARRADAVTGLPSAGLVDELTRGLIVTDTLRETLAEVIESDASRLRLVLGPPGAGKSTLMSVLIRPALVDTLDVTAGYISAAAFLDKTSTIETLTKILVAQLVRRVPGFADARDSIAKELTDDDRVSLDSFELELYSPLERCRQPGKQIRILIDGLDQPDQGGRESILAAITRIDSAERASLGHVKLIVSTRSGLGVENHSALTGAHHIEVRPPTILEALGPNASLTALMMMALPHDHERNLST